jgi:hypothetical protein
MVFQARETRYTGNTDPGQFLSMRTGDKGR